MEINRELNLEDTVAAAEPQPSALDRAGKTTNHSSEEESETSEPKPAAPVKKKKKKRRKGAAKAASSRPSAAAATPKHEGNELPPSQRSYIGLPEDKQQEILRQVSNWSGLSTTAGNGQLGNARMLASLSPTPKKVWDDMVSSDFNKLEILPAKTKHDPHLAPS